MDPNNTPDTDTDNLDALGWELGDVPAPGEALAQDPELGLGDSDEASDGK